MPGRRSIDSNRNRGAHAFPSFLQTARARARHREVALAGTGPADQHHVAFAFEERTGGELAPPRLVDRAGREVEVRQLLGHRQLRDRHLVLSRARLLVGDLRGEQLTDDVLYRMATLEPLGQNLVEHGAHPRELERAHHLEHFMTCHGWPPSSARNGGRRPPADDEGAHTAVSPSVAPAGSRGAGRGG